MSLTSQELLPSDYIEDSAFLLHAIADHFVAVRGISVYCDLQRSVECGLSCPCYQRSILLCAVRIFDVSFWLRLSKRTSRAGFSYQVVVMVEKLETSSGVVVGVLARVGVSDYDRLFQKLTDLQDVTPFAVNEERGRVGLLIEKPTLNEAVDTLSNEVDSFPEVLGTWPVYCHDESTQEKLVPLEGLPENCSGQAH